MQALIIVLNEVDYLEVIISKFVEIGVKGATIIDSQGMARIIAEHDLPIFGSLRALFNGAHPSNKTIFTVIENEELLHNTVAAVKEIATDAKRPSFGVMFTIPVDSICHLGSQ